MHKDVIKVPSHQVIRPQGEIFVVYFSSLSNNTHRFVEKLQVPCQRIPYSGEEIVVDQNYVLFVPTYSGGDDSTLGAVPKQVIRFLNNSLNRQKCAGVIASGNTNFGNSFAIAGPILSKKLNVPLLYQFELLGTHEDVDQVKAILTNFWLKGKKLNG